MMYKSPAHKRLQKHMDKIRRTSSYKNQVKKLGGTPLKPGEQNKMKPTMEEGGAGQMGTPELTAKYASMTPGQRSVMKTIAKRKSIQESPNYMRAKELARAGMVSKKDMSKFELIMRKMDMGKDTTQKEKNFIASIYDDLLNTILKDPSLFTRFRSMARKGQMKEWMIADLEEKVLTKAEKKKREEVAQAIERDNPGMPMSKKMAIATATAKRVAEEACCDDCSSLDEELIEEEVLIREGDEKKKVKLNKIQRGGSKKFYVYTRNDKGNVVKVSFGDPGLSIKRDDPERRKSFRARHNCDNPGPKWKARYWSCRQWRAGSKVEG